VSLLRFRCALDKQISIKNNYTQELKTVVIDIKGHLKVEEQDRFKNKYALSLDKEEEFFKHGNI
jgi:hypothetical protein